MSAYYVIGSNKKLNNLNYLHLGFEEISSADLAKYIKNVEFCKNFYYVSDAIMSKMIYDDKTDIGFCDFTNNETDMYNFIKYLRKENSCCDVVEFYKFWSIFNNTHEDDVNEIYENEQINILEYEESDIDFDFNIRYIFEP